MSVSIRAAALMLGVLVSSMTGSAAQSPTGGGDFRIRGTALVHVGPVEADTLPILCRDRDRPELGFVTQTADPEWTPRLALGLSRSDVAPEQAVVALELGGTRYSATFPAGESGEGYYLAMADMAADDGSPSRIVSFTATCRERWARSPITMIPPLALPPADPSESSGFVRLPRIPARGEQQR